MTEGTSFFPFIPSLVSQQTLCVCVVPGVVLGAGDTPRTLLAPISHGNVFKGSEILGYLPGQVYNAFVSREEKHIFFPFFLFLDLRNKGQLVILNSWHNDLHCQHKTPFVFFFFIPFYLHPHPTS